MTPEASYQIDHRKLARHITPQAHRTPKYLGFVDALLAPIASAYAAFLVWREGANYRMAHNSQVCYLQAALNDSFDPEPRRIYIRNAEIKQPLWVYEPEDLKPVYLYEPEDDAPVYIREDSEFFGGGTDFTVWVPMELHPGDAGITAYLVRMRGLVDYYKLYCKNYNIVFY